MTGFIALGWRPGAAAAAAAIRAGLAADAGLRQVVDRHDLAVFLARESPLPHVLLPGLGVVVGSLFDRAEAFAGRGRVAQMRGMNADDPAVPARKLAAEAFGAYVAILPDPEGGFCLFRDPLGALECLTWMRDGVQVAASRLEPAAPHAPRGVAIDWPALGAVLRQKALCSDVVPLRGVAGVGPGVLRRSSGAEQRLWRPADHALARRLDIRPRDLARTIDGCVAAWATGRRRILCEVSGGLDSAIVLAALQRAGAPVVAAIHHYWAEPEADERRFARAVAEMAGLELTEEARGLLALDAASLAPVAASARPSFSAADPAYDADMAARLVEGEADGLFTGQGGDAVFFQMTGARLAADLLCGHRAEVPRLRALTLLARRSRRTVWDLLADAWRIGRRPIDSTPSVSFLGPHSAVAQAPHPWLRGLAGVSAAKQQQIRALTHNQSMFGDSLRARQGRLIQPLMSQPVVELCLAIEAPRLAIGETDRPFARAAFADRLPPTVLERRWKGDLSVFFARSMAENLAFLRAFLLEGQLAAHGLIDPGLLDPILDRDRLIWFDHAGELTVAFLLEAWVRHWARVAR